MADGIDPKIQDQLVRLGMVSETLAATWKKGEKSETARRIAEENLSRTLEKKLKLSKDEADATAKKIIQEEKSAQKQKEVAESLASAATKAVRGVKDLASGAVSAASAAVTSAEVYSAASGTLTLLGNVVKTITDVIATAFSTIPFLGGFLSAADKAVGAITDISIQVLQMQLEMAQKYVNSYQALSKAGASFGGSMRDAQLAAQSMGLSLERYQKFVTENVEALSSFGGGIGNASKIVGKMGQSARAADQALLTTYGTQEDINGALSGYTQMMAGYGIDIAKSQKALTAGSVDYLWRLKELTELTGISADRYKKEAAERQNNIIFQRRMQSIQGEFVKRYGEEEGTKRFAQYANQVNEQLSIIGEKQGPEVAKAVMDAFGRGGTGQVIDADTIALFANSPAIRNLAEGVITMGNNLTIGKEADVQFARLQQTTITNLSKTVGALENFPGVAKFGDVISTATAKAIANISWSKDLVKVMGELADRRKAKKDDMGYGKAYDEKVRLEIEQNQITSKNLKDMGAMAAAMYEIQKKLIENFGDFSSAVVNFGKFVDKLINEAHPDEKKKSESFNTLAKNIKGQIDRNTKNLSQAEAKNILANGSQRDIQMHGGKKFLESRSMGGTDVQPDTDVFSQNTNALKKLGLTIKEGALSRGAGYNTRIDDVMAKFMESPDAGKFKIGSVTGLNDEYHEARNQKSAHSRGEAIDFTLAGVDGFNPANFSKAQGEALVKALKEAGFSQILDEYHTKSEGWTGGHIHAALKDGAIVDPVSGGRTVKVGEGGRPEGVFPIDHNNPVPMRLDERQFEQLVRILIEHRDISENLLSNS